MTIRVNLRLQEGKVIFHISLITISIRKIVLNWKLQFFSLSYFFFPLFFFIVHKCQDRRDICADKNGIWLKRILLSCGCKSHARWKYFFIPLRGVPQLSIFGEQWSRENSLSGALEGAHVCHSRTTRNNVINFIREFLSGRVYQSVVIYKMHLWLNARCTMRCYINPDRKARSLFHCSGAPRCRYAKCTYLERSSTTRRRVEAHSNASRDLALTSLWRIHL